jgi:saccharopine dehydrogenase (NAD+, L-glutamate forming)
VEVVDVTDLVGLLELAGRTRVLATTVGPYAELGELVVQACVRSGTHYADITGEPAFVNLLLERYDGDARTHGVRVVNCCGFDSVPHDLGARFTARQLPTDAPMTVKGFVRASAMPSGGTWQSAVAAMAGAGPSSLRTPRLPAADDGSSRKVRGLGPRVVRDPAVDGWGVPLPTIDAAVVLRSAAVLGEYGPDFRYGHYARVRRLPTVAGAIGGAGLLLGLAKVGPTRRLLLGLRSSGDGPSASQREAGWFEVTFVGRSGDQQVVTRVAGGDPGYAETSRMLGEAALAIVQDDLPERSGVLTPAVAFGDALQARLQSQGMTFEVVDA